MIFLEKAKELFKRVSGMPYRVNDGFVHNAIYYLFLGSLLKNEPLGISEQFR
jgi:hypothetical protein